MSTVTEREVGGQRPVQKPFSPGPGLTTPRRLMQQVGLMEAMRLSLAEARQELQGLDEKHEARIRQEAAEAHEILYLQAMEQFDRDHRRWRRAPELFLESVGKSWMGAMMLSRIWAALIDALRPGGPGLSLELIYQAMMASGSPWKVQHANDKGWWLLARYLNQHAQPDKQAELWLKKSRDNDTASHLKRLNHYRAAAPQAGEALAQLRKQAEEQATFWLAEARRLEREFHNRVAFHKDNAAGTGLGDRRMMADARVFMALRKAARDHVARLEKRLMAMKKERQKRRDKQDQKLDREMARFDKSLMRPGPFTPSSFTSTLPPSPARSYGMQLKPEPPAPAVRSPKIEVPPLRANIIDEAPLAPKMQSVPPTPHLNPPEANPLTQKPLNTPAPMPAKPPKSAEETRAMLKQQNLPTSLATQPKRLFKRS